MGRITQTRSEAALSEAALSEEAGWASYKRLKILHELIMNNPDAVEREQDLLENDLMKRGPCV